MTRPRRARLLWPLLLLAACGVAGARLYDDWRRPPAGSESGELSAAAVGGAATPAGAPEAALALPPPEQFAVIVERPLFAQTRRPPPPAPPAAAEPAPPAETEPEPDVVETPPPEPPPAVDFTLVGVVTDGSERHALVRRQSDGAVVEVPEGGDISGWFAVLIDPERAVFRQGGTEEELVLQFDAPVPADQIPPPRVRATPPAVPPADNGAGDNGTATQ
ncbi:MAG TPA: hypothetical protein VGQ90_13160 [Stellaceae bacterium]|jgi:general secretion pathway protein N|nr:hypothetical protein [Stellaceae bacterium]